MSAALIDGKAFAAKLRQQVAADVAELKASGVSPGLAVVLVGDNAASEVYVRNKGRQTREVGMVSVEHRLPAETREADLLSLVATLNTDPEIDGILVQLPLPDHIDAALVIDAIAPEKDVDGFHIANVGRLTTGQDGLVPCTPLGCLMLLKEWTETLAGAQALVIGRSNIVGKPMAHLLLGESATVTVAHSRTRNLPELCRAADVVIAAVGRPEMVLGEWIKPGAIVIDVGINRIAKPDGGTRLVGDVHFASAREVAGAVTPVPGGVGPMTIACLLVNTLTACRRRRGVDAKTR
ncbi:MAG: bifunctional methylenetetrahydrofolate dehydrogenase/methenyltetrahydrofolate cyclohydrolase FolD [Pseudomonadota bacterium]